MKKPYEKPGIVKLQTGLANKFGANPVYARKIRREIDGVEINKLVEEFGSPLYVFSEKKLRERFREISNAFSTRYPKVVFGWSYKTNYLKAVCAVLHDEGAIAEVVSEFEYDKARNLGVSGEDIIFNGPKKSIAALKKSISEEAIINVDHFDEIYDLEGIAAETGKGIDIGIRLNMDTGIFPQWSRFGFNLESGHAMEAVKRISGGGKLVLKGLHCHLGTFVMEPEAYAVQVEKMARFACQVEDDFGFKIKYLDIGGGFPSKSRLKGTYLPPEVALSSHDTYAEKITAALYKHLRPGEYPKLILETGRAIIDEAGYLITTVTSSKRLPDGRKAYVTDAGTNNLFTSFWYRFNIEMDRETAGMNEPSIIHGPLCMDIDVMDEGTLLPPLARGTRLIFSPVGAYNITQSMQFIEYRPNVVMIGERGEIDIIREAEDLSDIERRERLPERLKLK